MKQFSLTRLGLKLAVLAILVLPDLASAQTYFNYNQYGDVLAGFRKTSPNAGSYEFVVDLGSVTNFLNVPMGNTINITNFSTNQLNNAFMDTSNVTDKLGFQDLQWSVFATFPASSPWVTPLGSFPLATLWYTLPRTNVNTQTQPPTRNSFQSQQNTRQEMLGVGTGANSISTALLTTNVNNNTVLVREPISGNGNNIISAFIADDGTDDGSIGDFGANGHPLSQSVENVTPDPFTSAQRDDFYQLCPNNNGVDPITGLASGSGYFMGYFTLNPNGSMTFTRASITVAAPVAGFSGTPTNIFVTQTVVFTNASTGSITNWVWNLGNGSVTNTSSVNVTNTYPTAGTYTVSLVVNGAGGSNTNTQAGYIIVYSKPVIGTTKLSGGSLILSGTTGVPGAQYRILTSTSVTNSLSSTNWIPVWTNTFGANGSYSYTNSTPTNSASFFILVTP
jgi:PKD repeat protein